MRFNPCSASSVRKNRTVCMENRRFSRELIKEKNNLKKIKKFFFMKMKTSFGAMIFFWKYLITFFLFNKWNDCEIFCSFFFLNFAPRDNFVRKFEPDWLKIVLQIFCWYVHQNFDKNKKKNGELSENFHLYFAVVDWFDLHSWFSLFFHASFISNWISTIQIGWMAFWFL